MRRFLLRGLHHRRAGLRGVPAMTVRAQRVFAGDVRRLGGIVTVSPVRDPSGGKPSFAVNHISRGGDVAFRSRPLLDEDRALEAAQVLAEFTGAVVRR